MKRIATALIVLALGMTFAVAPAMAQQVFGGHNETAEGNAALWATGAPTPGGVAGHGAAHLLITEIIVTPTPVELVEIHNPTGLAVDLTNYYITDAWFEGIVPPSGYWQLPGGAFSITTNSDFCSRFPAGTIIGPGATIVVAMYGAGVDSTYGPGTASFEVCDATPGIPNMITAGGNAALMGAAATTLTNGSEFIALFYWDQISDNVCDVDYVTWGPAASTSRVDKTGLGVDAPGGDLTATPYFPDTPDASQSTVTAPGIGSSVARLPGLEGAEPPAGGNGCIPGAPTPTNKSTWGKVKSIYRN